MSKWFYPSGVLYALIEEGRRSYFYESGQLKTVEEYRDGMLHGGVQLFWPNGELKRRAYFCNGKRHGSDQMWDSSGALKDEGFYEEGVPVGIHRRWGRLGGVVEETHFMQKGKCHFKQWDEAGCLIREEHG